MDESKYGTVETVQGLVLKNIICKFLLLVIIDRLPEVSKVIHKHKVKQMSTCLQYQGLHGPVHRS